MTRQMLMENVYFTYIPSEKFKTSLLSAQLAVPLRRETAAQNALLVNVLSRGTARCPDMASLNRELDMLYGANLGPAVRKRGENQVVGFTATCIDDRFLPPGEQLLEKLTGLLGDMLCDPAAEGGRLVEAYVDSERANLADLIRSDVNDKRSYANRRLVEAMCAGEPFGVSRMGSLEDVECITRDGLDSHYHTLLAQGRLELFYCGSAPEGRVLEALSAAFARLPRQGRLEPGPTVRRPAPEAVRVVEEEMDVTQGKLCVGYRTMSSDEYATMLMETMFGGFSSSKLFLNVREKLSLCYYASSAYQRQKGLLTVSSGIAFENYSRALEAIEAQLEAIRQGEWEEWELQGARSSLLSGLRSIEDSAWALEDFVISKAVAGSSETISELMEGIEAVTGERIQEAAKAVRPDTVYFLKGKEGRA